MAKASTKNASSKKKYRVSRNIPSQHIPAAWVWTQYKAELQQSIAESDAVEKYTNISRDEAIEQNIRKISATNSKRKNTKEGFTKVDMLVFGGIALILLSIALYIGNKPLKNNVIKDLSSKHVIYSGNTSNLIARDNSQDKIDPIAIELLRIASENIREAKKYGGQPELDEALANISKIRDQEISRALNELRKATVIDQDDGLNDAIHNLEKITK